MIAKDYINKDIPELSPQDNIQKAIDWMEDFKLTHLPVVNEEAYEGLISEEILLAHPDYAATIGDFELLHKQVFVQSDHHVYDVMTIVSENRVSVVPVVDHNDVYEGIIPTADLIEVFSEISSVRSTGGIIVLEMRDNDYSLAEISRIIESNGAKVLSSYVMADQSDPTRMRLTLKLNLKELNSVINALERYDYQIVAKFLEDNEQDDQYERLDNLFKFLDM